jgi:hypothetical protein
MRPSPVTPRRLAVSAAGEGCGDGHIDFEKETSHPSSVAVVNKPQWSGGMPRNVRIGYKQLVYDLPNGDVKQELWIDTTDGANGGTWTVCFRSDGVGNDGLVYKRGSIREISRDSRYDGRGGLP